MKLLLAHNPIAKARHRHRSMGNKVITFDPQCKDKMGAKWELESQMHSHGFKSFQEGPLFMSLINYTPIPDSWSQKRKKEAEGAPCVSRPDLDNYVKFYSDVLNEVAYGDDKQITRLWSEKIYSVNPRVEITIEPLGANMIKEHAITVNGQINAEQLNYLIKKANKIGLQKREVVRVYSEEDEEGRHIYFEAEGYKIYATEA